MRPPSEVVSVGWVPSGTTVPSRVRVRSAKSKPVTGSLKVIVNELTVVLRVAGEGGVTATAGARVLTISCTWSTCIENESNGVPPPV